LSLYVFTGTVQKIGRFCYEALNPYSEGDKSSRKSSAPQIGKLAFFSHFTGLIKINNIMFLSVLYIRAKLFGYRIFLESILKKNNWTDKDLYDKIIKHGKLI